MERGKNGSMEGRTDEWTNGRMSYRVKWKERWIEGRRIEGLIDALKRC